ncbi:AMMECR1 domain protein [Yasminevirus sp. GU-2018]|uniref:AMMECR1 domain protein n=1 Tax=Yasminevirus sp. GU-2018 TaxID=2420051 RepID=A0A5K0U9F1_9VIRU|nr:AMMECR1 domain protein [Yasminevirus sp. GU-2018]
MSLNSNNGYDDPVSGMIDSVIDHALFGKMTNTNFDLRGLVTDIFGCFVTVVRSDSSSVLSESSDRVHGCIGYWDPDCNELSRTELFSSLMRASVDAVHKDPRKERFGSLYSDFDAYIEITLMTLPLIPIDKVTGIMTFSNTKRKFDNDDFGAIVEDSDKSKFKPRATFLPGVFHQKSWDYVSNQLSRKAGVDKSGDTVKFYAYKGVVYKKSLADRFISHYIDFINDSYTNLSKIPYQVSRSASDTYNVTYDSGSYVRNIATLRDLTILVDREYNISEKIKGYIKKDVKH